MTKTTTNNRINGVASERMSRSMIPLKKLLTTIPEDVPRNMVLTHIVNIDEHLVGELVVGEERKMLEYLRAALFSRVMVEHISEDAFAIATIKVAMKPTLKMG